MYKYLTILALALFAFTACQTNTSTTDQPDNDPSEVPQPAANLGTEDDGVIRGENYEVTVIDGTIKSPRKELTGTVGDVPVSINYGSPSVNKRTIYGDLVPYEKVWRTGANEATRITFKEPVMVGTEGKKLDAGTYALFTKPMDRNNWTIIFNKNADQWGAYDYDEKDDVAMIKGTAMDMDATAEHMDFAVEEDKVMLKWADLAVAFPVKKAAK